MTDQLPSTWTLATLEQLLSPLNDGRLLHHGWSPQCEKEPAESEEEWGVLKTTAIQPGAFFPEHNKKLPAHLPPRSQHEVKVGDLLITCAGPRVRCGIPCLVKNTRPKLMLSGKMYRFRVPDRFVDSGYVEKYLLSRMAQLAIDAMKTGGSESGLNLTHDRFKPLPVPLAPINEQRRIASKIDELFSRIDEGERALERVRKLVERYRQSVLKAAVTGELTRSWREKNRDKLESGEALLARILTARREAWEKAELEKLRAKGSPPFNDKWKQKYEEPVPPDTTGLPQLPAGWAYSRLESLVAPGGFMTDGDWVESKDQDPNGDVRLIQLADVGDGVFRNKSSRFLTSEKARELGCTYLLPGDVLIARLGDPLGKTCLFPAVEKPCVTVVDVHIVRCLNDTVSREWLVQLINSPQARSRISADMSGTTRQRITGAKLKDLVIPVPGVDEQRQIAERIAEAMCQVKRVAESALHQARVSEALRQSILKAAFCGRLVAQDPVDEPASTLLERIAAERGADTAAPKRGRKKKTTA